MIPESTVHITDKPLSSAINLREGSFVFVRVLDKKADGTYTVSFAGQRFSVSADKALRPGDSFPAKLTTDGKRIILLPDSSKRDIISQNSENHNIAKMSDMSNLEVEQYFATLGLASDELSKRIVSFMQLMWVKINPEKAAFIREMALKFPGREEKAAEAISILEDKGIPVTEENIEKLMLMIEGSSSADNEFTAGVNALSGEKNWIIIPYEYTGEKSFHGSACLLKEPDGTVSRLLISSRNEESFFLFRIYLNYGINKTKIKECTVTFTVRSEKGNPSEMETKLKKFLHGTAEFVNVQYVADTDIGFFSDDDIALVRANA